MYRRLILIAALLVAYLQPIHAAPRAAWTVMVYLDANNNLEADEIANLEDMAGVGSTPNLNIVVLCARSENNDADNGYSSDGVLNLPDWSTGKLLAVQKGRLRPLADWGKVNMASGKTLERFITVASTTFPAQRYALIISDHGLSWPGVCGDEREGHEGDILHLRAIRHALARFAENHDEPIELLGFDACLMGNYETAQALVGQAHYLVGSEELEPSFGWAFQATLRKLAKNPAADGALLGKWFTTDFLEQFTQSDDEDVRALEAGVTLSVIDLTKMATLVGAVDAFSDALREALVSGRRQGWIQLASIRRRADQYGRTSEKGEDDSQVFDLGHFARIAAKVMPNSEVAAAADDVLAALRDAVVHNRHGSGHPNASGLSIYVPIQKRTLESTFPVRYADVPQVADSGWLSFLAAFTGSTALQPSRLGLDKLILSGSVIGPKRDSINITSRTDADDIDEAWFVLARREDDHTVIMGQTQAGYENGRLSEEWDGSWFTISSGDTDLVAPIDALDELDDEPDTYIAQVPAQYKRARGQVWQGCTLYFKLRFKDEGGLDGRYLYTYTSTPAGQRQVTLRTGDHVRPVFTAIDDEGEETEITSDDGDEQLVVGKTPIVVDYEQLDAGDYLVGFLISDYAGRTKMQMSKVHVEER